LIINLGLCCGNLGVSKKVGDRIRKYRQLAGLNQEYVAEEIGMSGGNFGKIERGEIDINTDYLYKLSKLFKIPVSEFFEEKPVSIVHDKNVPYGYATKADLETLTDIVKKLATEVEKLREAIPKRKTTKTAGRKKN
jgi:transcriptional regulator with XRE-family HTH domain